MPPIEGGKYELLLTVVEYLVGEITGILYFYELVLFRIFPFSCRSLPKVNTPIFPRSFDWELPLNSVGECESNGKSSCIDAVVVVVVADRKFNLIWNLVMEFMG